MENIDSPITDLSVIGLSVLEIKTLRVELMISYNVQDYVLSMVISEAITQGKSCVFYAKI